MSDSYQAIYDAVRSRISNGDIGSVIERVAREALDASHVRALAQEAIGILTNAYDRPSAVYRPTLSVDGNMYCALYGLNLHEGCAGFGETPEAAMLDFDKNWRSQKAPQHAQQARKG